MIGAAFSWLVTFVGGLACLPPALPGWQCNVFKVVLWSILTILVTAVIGRVLRAQTYDDKETESGSRPNVSG